MGPNDSIWYITGFDQVWMGPNDASPAPLRLKAEKNLPSITKQWTIVMWMEGQKAEFNIGNVYVKDSRGYIRI